MTSPPPPEEIRDPATLKALTHPRRLRILRELRHGPATATMLAKALGENTGATSYHLRQLAEHGYIEEAPEQAHGRQRWWRTRSRDVRFPRRSQQSAEARTQFDELHRRHFDADIEMFNRFQKERDSMGDWGDMVPFSRGTLRLTAEETLRFFEEYMELFRRYWRRDEDAPEDARLVALRFIAFPRVDKEVSDEE